MMPVNLIPKDRIATRRARRAARAWAIGLGAFSAVIVAACLIVSIPVSADAPKVQADLERLAARLDSAEKDKARLEKLVSDRRARLAGAKAVGEHPDWSLLLESVARSRADDAVLESFELSTQKIESKPTTGAPAPGDAAAPKPAKPRISTIYALKLIGYTPTPGGVFAYARRLEELGVFDQVSVKDTHAFMLGSMPATRFEINAAITEPSAPPVPATPPEQPR